MPLRRLSGGAIVYLVVGVVIAAAHHFFDSLSTVSAFLSALLAVVLWPLVLFNLHLDIHI